MSRRNSLPSPSSSERKKSRDRLFHLVLHENEERGSSSVRRMRRKGLMASVTVPGALDIKGKPCELKSPELTYRGRNIIVGMKNLVSLMHKKGLTLKGNFCLKNFVWIPATRQVRFKEVPVDSFSSYTEPDALEDYKMLAAAVEHLLDNHDLPCDLSDWLHLLKTDPIGKQYLVDFHMALKSPSGKVKHFVYLYGLLEQLKLLSDQGDNRSKKRYRKVVSFKRIPSADWTKGKDWKEDAWYNSYLDEVYDFKKNEYESAPSDASALLAFVRHCTQHLVDKSVEARKIIYRYDQMHVMIEAAIPGVFHQFQHGMFVHCGAKDFEDDD